MTRNYTHSEKFNAKVLARSKRGPYNKTLEEERWGISQRLLSSFSYSGETLAQTKARLVMKREKRLLKLKK